MTLRMTPEQYMQRRNVSRPNRVKATQNMQTYNTREVVDIPITDSYDPRLNARNDMMLGGMLLLMGVVVGSIIVYYVSK